MQRTYGFSRSSYCEKDAEGLVDSDDEIEGGETDVNNDWSAHPHHPHHPRWHCAIAYPLLSLQRTTLTPCAVRGAALLLQMQGT